MKRMDINLTPSFICSIEVQAKQDLTKFVNYFHGVLNYNIFVRSQYVIHLKDYTYKFQGYVLKD